MSMEEFYNQICQWFYPTKHMGMLPEAAEKIARQGGIRFVRSRYSIYAFVNKTSVDQVSKRPDLHGNTCNLHGNLPSQSPVIAKPTNILDLNQESHEFIGGYMIQIYGLNPHITRILSLARSRSTDGQQPWIYYRESLVVTGNTIRQENDFAKPRSQANTDAEVSIVDTIFAHKVGCYIESDPGLHGNW
ncbi:hypothetical protein PHMEG_00015944 [Phytophthora megakarya]|uniref:Uncharacterized protein n=1 Tax=Phytophthora megakarya TaxID=4795 RepID=A0A225W1I9_9STRA|nr:hypothetical protein PHMEG_00015944 [Phytophthora megakarya]